MRKRIAVCITFVLLLTSVSSATIVHQQLMALGATNGVLIGGSGFNNATSLNMVFGSNLQQSSSANGHVQAFQYQDGTHFQVAFAAGEGGAFGVDQIGKTNAGQNQVINNNVGQSNQNLDTDIYQGIAANGGNGYVGAIDGFVGHQVQVSLSRNGMDMNITRLNMLETGYIRRK